MTNKATTIIDDNLYKEEIPLANWATLMLGIMIIALTPTVILELFAISREPRLLWLYFSLDLFFIAVMLNFRKLVITIDAENFLASFGLITKRIKLNEIKSCISEDASLSIYTGLGIRFGGDGSLAFLPSLGDAVKIYYGSSRPFVFSTKNREYVLQIIKQYCV
jgi:hypothetical protein